MKRTIAALYRALPVLAGLALLLPGGASAQVKVDAGSAPELGDAPEEGVVMQPTHKEKFVFMPRVGYFKAFEALGPNPNNVTPAEGTDPAAVNAATPMGPGRWNTVGQWTAGVEYRQDIATRFFIAIDVSGVFIGEGGYGVRLTPIADGPVSLGAGTRTLWTGAGVGTYVRLGNELTWLRLAGKFGYLYGVSMPLWANIEFQQHIPLVDSSYVNLSVQGMLGVLPPAAAPPLTDDVKRGLWIDQMRMFAGFQVGIARVFNDRKTQKTENPAEKLLP